MTSNFYRSPESSALDYRRLYVLSRGVRQIPTLATLLDDYQLEFRPRKSKPAQGSGVIAWGKRPSAVRAQEFAYRHDLAVHHIEDGFLRSVGLGRDDPPLSIVIDDLGLYLDASRPSRLEALVKKPLTNAEHDRARSLISAWREARVSKYNHSPDLPLSLPDNCVLVVDQTRGDASVACGSASAGSFRVMIEAAMREHPNSTILLKIHPDVIAGRKHGYFDLAAMRALAPRVRVLDFDVHPAALLSTVRTVYTVTSQLGFEALLWGVPVRVFGMPFYAGWGLTEDEFAAPVRRSPVPLVQLVHAALVDYPRYVDPETGRRCEVEIVLAWIGLQRRMRTRFGSSVQAIGFSGWKKKYVREFFAGSSIHFRRKPSPSVFAGTQAVWGRKYDMYFETVPSTGGTVVRVEDGFLRSVGLGADLTRPLSWVQDDLGIYYDATRTSRLEVLLKHGNFSSELIGRAAMLRSSICAAGITKYNLSGPSGWAPPAGRRVILVPGQVETDASIRYGASEIRTNLALLAAVRSDNREAHIIYKPHPDVVAGLRKAGKDEIEVGKWCDEVVDSIPIVDLLGCVDEVHVLTSLAGFEALLRQVPVVTYGQPFYAGWGLARDVALSAELSKRRGRQLLIDELVAAVLILYPTYISRRTHRYTTPEQALKELMEWRTQPDVPKWRHFVARLFREA